MRTVIVQYKTTEAHADTNAALIRGVFEELRTRHPKGVRYSSYRLEGGQRFVHVATIEGAEQNPLTSLAAFKLFQEQLKSRCEEPPIVTEASIVGSYDGQELG
jgi:hypothetical protein